MKDRILFVCAAAVVLAGSLTAICRIADAQQNFGCRVSARNLGLACHFDARDTRLTTMAQCQDATVVDPACIDSANEEYRDEIEECGDVIAARLEICDALDDAVHEPMFGLEFAASFVDPSAIGAGIAVNPWFPLVAGNRWVYENEEEMITVTVTDKIKLIDGIRCVVVNDVVVDEDGVLVEDTDDWYAQDTDGNVWYCGEIAENYELFEGDEPAVPELTDIEGSWKHGRDRAKAGILFPAAPVVGQTIRQEVLYTDAEDVIEILSITASESAPGGACAETCLQTRDFTPLEPGVEEHKFFAPGIGLIVEETPGTDERLELVEFTGAGS